MRWVHNLSDLEEMASGEGTRKKTRKNSGGVMRFNHGDFESRHITGPERGQMTPVLGFFLTASVPRTSLTPTTSFDDGLNIPATKRA